MKKHTKRFLSVLLVILVSSLFLFANGIREEIDITVLETSDIHGVIAPFDYATGMSQDRGLAQAATIIKQQRAIDPDLLLCDDGDTTQDNMIQEFRNDDIHPIVKAMNYLGYDTWTLGNHEWNFEFDNLKREIAASNATVLAGNVYKADGTRFLPAYTIKEVKGLKVAIIGLTAPHVTRWEASNPEHFNNMTFTTPDEELGKVLDEVEGKADVVIVTCHYGEDGEYGTTGMYDVADKYADRVDAFLIGHAHSTKAETRESGAVIVEPGSKASNVAKVTIKVLRDKVTGKVYSKTSTPEMISTKGVEADPGLSKEMAYVDIKSKAIADEVVGQVGADFLPSLYWKDLPGIPTAVCQDTAMMDLINIVQMNITGADVSLAALFDSSSNLPKGDFKKRDGVKVYKYDNTLMAVRITGKQLKAIMEQQAGNYFNTYTPGDVTLSFNPKIRLYNYDMFAGVDYKIDISKPQGQRIVDVMFKGAPLADDQVLVLALNNYRYGGLSGSGMISAAPEDLVYNTGLAVRDSISDYVVQQGTIMPVCDNNWEIIGYDFSDPAAEEIYQMIRDGKIKLPTSADGRSINIKAVNANDLRAEGVIK